MIASAVFPGIISRSRNDDLHRSDRFVIIPDCGALGNVLPTAHPLFSPVRPFDLFVHFHPIAHPSPC